MRGARGPGGADQVIIAYFYTRHVTHGFCCCCSEPSVVSHVNFSHPTHAPVVAFRVSTISSSPKSGSVADVGSC